MEGCLRLANALGRCLSPNSNYVYISTGRNQLTGTVPAEVRALTNSAIDYCKSYEQSLSSPLLFLAGLCSQFFRLLGIAKLKTT